MKIESFNAEAIYSDKNIVTKVVLETSFSKEIRIFLKEGQLMKEHKAPFPIIVHLLDGKIDFGVNGITHTLIKNDVITLDANVPHDLKALEDSMVRLTLSKQDKVERVKEVISNS